MEVNGQPYVTATLFPVKNLRYPLDKGLGGQQSRSGRDTEEKNSSFYRESNLRSSNGQSRYWAVKRPNLKQRN
jgi:hypothetical protein